MVGHRPFSDLMKDWSPEPRARSDVHKAKMAVELASHAGGLIAAEQKTYMAQ